MTEAEMLEAARRMKVMAQTISKREQELLVREKKLADREATLAAAFREFKDYVASK